VSASDITSRCDNRSIDINRSRVIRTRDPDALPFPHRDYKGARASCCLLKPCEERLKSELWKAERGLAGSRTGSWLSLWFSRRQHKGWHLKIQCISNGPGMRPQAPLAAPFSLALARPFVEFSFSSRPDLFTPGVQGNSAILHNGYTNNRAQLCDYFPLLFADRNDMIRWDSIAWNLFPRALSGFELCDSPLPVRTLIIFNARWSALKNRRQAGSVFKRIRGFVKIKSRENSNEIASSIERSRCKIPRTRDVDYPQCDWHYRESYRIVRINRTTT